MRAGGQAHATRTRPSTHALRALATLALRARNLRQHTDNQVLT